MTNEFLKYTKRTIIISLPLLAFILANVLTNMHLKHFCIIKWLTNHECWGCGMTRAFAALSRFDFLGAYEYNHGIIIAVPLMLIIWGLMIHFEFKQDKL